MKISNAPFTVSLLAAAIALTGCGGDSSSSSSDDARDGETGNPVSGFTISAKGGNSDLGDGGDGGQVSVIKYNSASQLSVRKDGKIATDYTLPAQEVDLGSNSVNLTESESVHLVHDEDEESRMLPPAGTLYMLDSDMSNAGPDDTELNINRLYKSDGITALGADATQVTGLKIDAGAALILPNHRNGSNITVYFRNDVQNDGTITTAKIPDASSRLGLELYAAAYYGSGEIDVRGDEAEYHGQNGGSISITAHTISNTGPIVTRGATDGTEVNGGGDGGDIQLNANVFVENKGTLNASGGSSTDDRGGHGGDVSLSGLEVYNSGSISSDSGEGRDAHSYSSSNTDISLSAVRTLINTADISAKGSNAHGDGNYNAGKGGDINLDLTSSFEMVGLEKTLVNSGNLNVDGGSTAGEAKGRGGNAGRITIEAAEEYLMDGDSPDSMSASSIATTAVITGSMSANGGDTLAADLGTNAYAGDGGQIRISVYDQSPSTVGTSLLGYESINVSGGTGMDGAEGGGITLLSGDTRDTRSGQFIPALSGPLLNSVDLIADGGASNAEEVAVGEDEEDGHGNRAGHVSMSVENGYAYLQPGVLTLTNTGTVSANGGRSFNNSEENNARGGSINVMAPDAVSITADISANGGSDEHQANSGDSSNHIGSDAGGLMVVSQYATASLEGSISLNGGHGDLQGGDAGILSMFTKTGVTANGTYSLNGGNALDSEDDAHTTLAGDAGKINILSASYNSTLAATITAEPGSGDQSGDTQVVVVDADCESDNCDVEDSENGLVDLPK